MSTASNKKRTFGKVDLERINVFVEAQRAHGPQQVLAIDSLAFFLFAFVAGLGGDEADEFRHTFLLTWIRQVQSRNTHDAARREPLIRESTLYQ